MDEVSSGRIYDAKIARFLQADPVVDGVTNTQGYNRYSYLHNNPLNATDPSGFSSWTKFRDKIRPFVGAIVGAVMTYFCGPYCGKMGYVLLTGAVSGAAGAAANGGNILRGALTGMVTAAVFNGIGNKFNVDMAKGGGNFWAAGVSGGARHIFTHAMVGGVLSVLQGGKFGHGFASAGLSKGFDANFNIESGDAGAFFAETVIVAVVGGTISEITGGKFANGAATSAFQHLFNEMGQRKREEQNQWAQFRAKMQNLIDSPPSLPQGMVDFAAGFGDGVSFGLADAVRDWMGTNGVVDHSSSEYGLSKLAGQLHISAILVGGVVLRPFTAQSQVVTQWTTAGQLGVNTRWVMTGGNSYRNYIMAGGPQLQASYSQSVTTTVVGSSLRWPSGAEWFKGFLGQRILK